MEADAVNRFVEVYQQLNKSNLVMIDKVYADDVLFIDAMHRIEGLPALRDYFRALYQNLEYCRFDIRDVQTTEGVAWLNWQMCFVHPKLAGGKEIAVDGATNLRFADNITFHRDYMDAGQMLYEHIPLLGSAIRYIKQRALS